MKLKRTILYVEHEPVASEWRLILVSRGYLVLGPKDVKSGLKDAGIDLALIGLNARLDESKLPMKSLRLSPDITRAETLERIRILLIRKRGPKPGYRAQVQVGV